MTAPKAIAGFYGNKKREQEIQTPQYIVDAICKVWGCIALDPCASDGSPATSLAISSTRTHGLEIPWERRTYCNSPFDALGDWMTKASAEASRVTEIMQLVPVRTHRNYWWPNAETADLIAWLKPVTFIGFEGTFPQPCAMLYWGHKLTQFQDAFASLSHKVTR